LVAENEEKFSFYKGFARIYGNISLGVSGNAGNKCWGKQKNKLLIPTYFFA
jgi:hypothetical protein